MADTVKCLECGEWLLYLGKCEWCKKINHVGPGEWDRPGGPRCLACGGPLRRKMPRFHYRHPTRIQ